MQSLATNRYRNLRSLKANGLSLSKTEYKAGAWSPVHAHENARFVFVLRGTFIELYGQRKRNCSPFTLIFRPPQEEHTEEYGPGVVCLSVDIEPWWMERLRQHSINFVESSDFRSGSLAALAIKLDSELDIGDQTSALAVEALLLETAVEAFRAPIIQPDNHAPRWLIRAKGLIHDEFASDLTLARISAVAGVHPTHLARVFRQHYRCTIAEYIRRLRVDAACSAIATSDSSLAEIAIDTGFSDQSHFCKVFKRLTHMTPAEYRLACGRR